MSLVDPDSGVSPWGDEDLCGIAVGNGGVRPGYTSDAVHPTRRYDDQRRHEESRRAVDTDNAGVVDVWDHVSLVGKNVGT